MAHIQAISYHLPDYILTNEEVFGGGSADNAAKAMGVVSRHTAAPGETAADMAETAARKLFAENGIYPADIDFLIYCTQSPDYFMPSTACTLQARLGLPTTAGAFGYDLGCSGYVYGLAIAGSFVDSGLARNVLLTGDTISKYLHKEDRNRLLFGDAASATFIGRDGMAEIGRFDCGTDGRGFEHIIIRNGANRHRPLTGEVLTDEEGHEHRPDYFDMNGEAVFNFTVERIPLLINSCLELNGIQKEDVDYYVFHQANRFMLNTLRKLNKLPKDNFFIDLSDTGNTTSTSVPIGLCKALAAGSIHKDMRVMVAGFGVGLSWAATILKF